jgi:SAM-dependent methyltransferase
LEYYGADVLSNNFGNFFCIDLNNKTLPFKSKQFDAVSCTDVLEHLFHPLEMMREIKRVLKDDGVVLISLPNDKGLNQIFLNIFKKIPGYEDSVYGHHWRFSIKTAREFVEKEFHITNETPEFGPIFRKYLFFMKFKKFASAWFMFGIKK